MPLKKSDLRKVRRWLADRIERHTCPACGAESWTIGDLLFLPHVKDPDLGQPVVAVVCGRCARAEFFDAVAMGLFER
jgi:hypothetical protein